MKKPILILSFICCFVLIFTGCSKGGPTEFKSINTDAYNCVFSVNRDLPSGYKLMLPYVELSVDEINSRWKGRDRNRFNTHEVEVFKDDTQVGYVDFFTKADNYDLKLREMNEKSEWERNPNSENITFIKEMAGADVICTMFSSDTPSMREVDPLFSQYCMFLGYFQKKPEIAFWVIIYDSVENGEAIFDALNLQFLHE